MDAYGGKCACCNEREIAFLTLDHKNGDGKWHVRGGGDKPYRMSGDVLYRWARRNGYPNFLQCLCMNCNFAKSHNPGGCPHQMSKVAQKDMQ